MTEVFLNKLKTMLWTLLYFSILDVNNQFWAHFFHFLLFVCLSSFFPDEGFTVAILWLVTLISSLSKPLYEIFIFVSCERTYVNMRKLHFLEMPKTCHLRGMPKVPLLNLCNSITLVHIWTAFVAKWEKKSLMGMITSLEVTFIKKKSQR